MSRLGAVVANENVLTSMEIHDKQCLKLTPRACYKCYSNLTKSKVDSSIPAASESLSEDKRPSGSKDTKTFIIEGNA